jgi:hypothetical protein
MNGRIVFPSGAWGTVGRAPYVPRQCHDHAADAPDTPDSTPSTPAIQRGRTFATRRSAKTTLITNLLTNQCARRRTCRHICAHLPRSERANHSSPLSMAWKWSGFESLSSTIGFSLERAARRREGVCRSGWRRGAARSCAPPASGRPIRGQSAVNYCRRPSLTRARWNLERLLCALSRRATIRR